MALIWADFPSGQQGLYGSTIAYMFNGIWAGYSGSSPDDNFVIADDPDPNIGSAGKVLQSLETSGVGDVDIRFALPAGATTEVGIGTRLWLSQLPEGDADRGNPRMLWKTTGNSLIAYIEVGATGQIIARNSSHTILGETGPVITANAYHHIEARCLRHASTGEIEVRVNGVVKLNLDTLALGASDIGTVAFGASEHDGGGVTPVAYWKDMFFWDTSGSEVNDFQGSVSVYDLLPDADDSFNWTPSTGTTGWDLIDDNAGPDDADYISADDTPPAASIFGMTNLPADVTSVRAVMSIGRMMKTDGGDCDIQMSLSPDGTNWDTGADRPITTAFTYWWDTSHVSPATSAAWTPSEVDALEFRIDRTL